MKNKPLIVAIVLILLFAIGGYWYMNKTPSSQSSSDKKVVVNNNPSSAMMSMKDLLASGKNQMCTFSHSSETGTQTGTSYMSSGKVRTEFNGTYADAKTYSGVMINDGSYVYTWTSEGNQGMKMAMTDSMSKAVEDAKQDFANNPNKYVNPDEKMDFKCTAWKADANMFVPPATITFTDYSEMMKQMQDSTKTNPDMKKAQCSACDSLPEGDSKTMCKKSLNCE